MNDITKLRQAPALVKAEEAAASPLLDQILTEMNALASRQTRVSPVRLRSLDDIERFAESAKNSGMVPKDYIGKKDMIIIAVQMGSELGLPPVQSLQNIAVVNGRPSVWGDALPGLCRASGMCRSIREWHEGEGDELTYYCEAIRKDDPNPIIGKFSVAQAKRAKLWQEKPTVMRRGRDGPYEADSGPWYSYRERMLQMRARGFALRDAFPDVLKGLITAEEAMDIPQDDAPPLPPPSSARARATAGLITEDQELQINELLTATDADLEKFLANYSPFKSVSEFSQAAAQNAILLLTRKKQQQAEAKADAAAKPPTEAAQTEHPMPAQSAEEKPQATQALQFEAVLLDEYSEPVRDDPFTDVIQYVRALMGLWEKSKNRDALMEHNADGIEDAKRLPAAATILKSMQEAPEAKPDPEEAELERIVTALKTYRDVKGIDSLARSPVVEAAAERWGRTHRDLIARMKAAFDARRAELRAGA